MAYGFVYLLANRATPCIYKIGCTERAPHQRAEELSRSTSVAQPFQVLLYIEADDFQSVERRFHMELSDFRVSASREFFCFGPAHMNWLRQVFRCYPFKASYAESAWSEFSQANLEPVETWTPDGDWLHMPKHPPIKPGELRLVA